jgi:hypothetical protein
MATAPPVLPSAQNQDTGLSINIATGNANANKVPADAATLPEVTVTASPLAKPDVVGNLTATDEIVAQPNVLDRFASYTYSASVYLMSTLQYQRLLRSKKKNINGYFLLFQSGGAPVNKGGFQGKGSGTVNGQEGSAEGFDNSDVDDFGRNPAFPQDFYIDSITVDNALPGKATQSPHMVTDLKFTVVEPGNITLLDRIHRAVQDVGQLSAENQPINYTSAAYLMVIRWYGYDINGNQVQVGAADPTTGLTDPNAVVEKFIPFLITGIQWQVSSKLVTYDFSCAPISQWIAGGTRRGTLTYDAEFSATTVSELLGNNLQYVAATAPTARPGNATTTGGKGGVFATPNYSQSAVNGSVATPAPSKASSAPTSSLTIKQGVMGAMNVKQQQLVKDGIYDVADTYAIEFGTHPSFPNLNIGDSTLRLPGNVVTQSNTAMSPGPAANANQALNPDANSMNSLSRKWSVASGMQLVQIIDQAVRKSSFIFNQQLTVIDQQTGEDVPVKDAKAKSMVWFEITMEAFQGKYDRKRNDYAYDIVFIVTPYPLQNFDSKYFPLTQFRGIHKSYPYWFTGQNTAVLDYTAVFNSLYNITVTGTEPKNNGAARQRELSTASMREIPFYTYAPSSTEDRQGEEGRALEAQANASEYLYSPGDQAEGKIRIIGDPAWIQQGSLAGGVNVKEFSYSPFLPDGTINFDAQQVMFEVAWQRPNDYDLNTGLADPYAGGNTKDRLPIQSNVYKANRVISEFRQGRFEQTIEGSLFMFPKPDGTNTVGKTAASNNALSKGPATNGANESAAETSQSARQNAQTPAAIEAANFNTALNNSVRNSSAFGKTGTLAAPETQLTNVAGATPPPAALNGNFAVGPSAYPQAPTGSGVNPIAFSANSPVPLNTNPFANAGRTQTIVRES